MTPLITLPRATVEQALEALERARPLKADYTTLEYFEEAKRKHYAAMAALRAALAQQAGPAGTRALIEECLAAFAEELAAWDIDPPLHHVKQAHDKCEAWLAAPPQQAEPVAEARYDGTLRWLEPHGVGLHRIQGPLFTAPPQRKPLTEEMEARCPYAKANPTLRGAFFDGWLNSERAHGITDPQVADRLARHGIPMPEGDPK